jgi:hypothetical protein
MTWQACLAALVALALTTAASHAGDEPRASRELWSFSRQDPAPPKDCTRLNGRYGYYGNPWCSHREQLRWDRWEAERLRRWTSRPG